MTLMVITTICIFQCDFNFWRQSFDKTKAYGISLMDIGISLFSINFGLQSSKLKNKRIFKT